MKKGTKIFIGVVAIGLLISAYGLYEYNRKPVATAALKPDVVLSAADIIDSFSNQAETAAKFFHDKVIEVSGMITSIDSTGNVLLLSLGKQGSNISVSCQMDSTEPGPYPEEGNPATLKGRFIGFSDNGFIGSDIMLSQCLMIRNEKK